MSAVAVDDMVWKKRNEKKRCESERNKGKRKSQNEYK